MFRKKLTKVMSLALMAILVVPSATAFAATETNTTYESAPNETDSAFKEMEDTLEEMESREETLTDNERWIAETMQTILNGDTVEYTNAAQVARLVQTGYAHNQKNGPFSITQGTLINGKDGSETPVYVIAISGTDTDTEGQTTDINTDLLVGFEKDNEYLQNIKKTMLANIPADSNIVLAGHSLGGMVAQQVAAEKELKATYNILNTIAFGSPVVSGWDREGDTKRLGDTKDKVPYMSITSLLNPFWQSWGLNKENGGYSDWVTAHVESYQREDVWGAYDVVGEKNGLKRLVLDYSTTNFYHSQKTVTEK